MSSCSASCGVRPVVPVWLSWVVPVVVVVPYVVLVVVVVPLSVVQPVPLTPPWTLMVLLWVVVEVALPEAV